MSPLLIVNPTDDESFGRLARSLVEAGYVDPREVQALLRGSYPNALVRPRELSNEAIVVWYVYRDGRWVRSRLPDEGGER